MRHLLKTALTGVASILALATAVHAAPISTLDRNGAYVSVEAYGPNIVHVTIAVDKAEVLKAPGYGILADHADNAAFKQTSDLNGDTFSSNGLTLHVNAAPAPHVPSQGEKYFAPSLAPVGLQIQNAKGETVLSMNSWEMSPHEVNGEDTYQVGAAFAAPAGEH
jgi:alpha-D-xyloside xylohydrolase